MPRRDAYMECWDEAGGFANWTSSRGCVELAAGGLILLAEKACGCSGVQKNVGT